MIFLAAWSVPALVLVQGLVLLFATNDPKATWWSLAIIFDTHGWVIVVGLFLRRWVYSGLMGRYAPGLGLLVLGFCIVGVVLVTWATLAALETKREMPTGAPAPAWRRVGKHWLLTFSYLVAAYSLLAAEALRHASANTN